MKRKFLILSVLALCFSLFAAETIAYFTADSKAHNVITTGGVQIAVQEWADEERTKPFEDVTGVMPETTVTKIVEIKNKSFFRPRASHRMLLWWSWRATLPTGRRRTATIITTKS